MRNSHDKGEYRDYGDDVTDGVTMLAADDGVNGSRARDAVTYHKPAKQPLATPPVGDNGVHHSHYYNNSARQNFPATVNGNARVATENENAIEPRGRNNVSQHQL